MSERKRAKHTHASSEIGEDYEVSQELILEKDKQVVIPQAWNLSEEELKKYLEPKITPIKSKKDMPLGKSTITADELKLLDKGQLEYAKRESKEKAALKKYKAKNPIVLKSFKADVQSLKEGESLYVFCFGYAKIWSTEYKDFLLSLTDDNFSRLYIGFNKDLAPGALISKSKQELRPGLRPVAKELGNSDDVGVLITNKPEVEILRKFAGYQEFDFAEPGNTPMKTLMYTKDHVLSLPPNRSAKSSFPILQKLGMPVELIDDGDGEIIKLTEDYIVCQERVRVTEKASKILKHLEIKMFNYVILPCCRWAVSSGETGYEFKNYYDLFPSSSWPSRV